MASTRKSKTHTKKPTNVSTKKKTTVKKVAKPTKAAKSAPPASTKQLKVGQKAPAFSLPNQEGKVVSLSDYKGKKVVLYLLQGVPKSPVPFGMGLMKSRASVPKCLV